MNDPQPLAHEDWWTDAAIYQIYLRSFADGNGDGVGDLRGLIARLDHIVDVGADGLWISPFYPSPQADHGYDVADYTAIDPQFGTLGDFEELREACSARNLRILLDLVPNHCSVAHPWFQEALADVDGRARSYFHFRPGRGADGAEPPNNWRSSFGGPAWTRVADGAWYLHMFGPDQPDLNWSNPEVVEYFESVLATWFRRGVDGFRIDVAEALAKDPQLPDWSAGESGIGSYNPAIVNRPELRGIHAGWRRVADRAEGGARLLVGEVWGEEPQYLEQFLKSDRLHQTFYFNLMVQPWDAEAVGESVQAGLEVLARTEGTLGWVLGNHDVRRLTTRMGYARTPPGVAQSIPALIARAQSDEPADGRLGAARARAMLMLVAALPGTLYVYQGDELGLPEVLDIPSERRVDPIFLRSGRTRPGRDGCRVPLPWSRSAPGFGFSTATGSSADPWLPQPDWFGAYAVEDQQSDPGSSLRLYRDVLRARRRIRGTAFVSQPRADVVAIERDGFLSVTVFGGPAFCPERDDAPFLTSGVLDGALIPPQVTAWWRTD